LSYAIDFIKRLGCHVETLLHAVDGVGAQPVPAAPEYPCSVCGGRLLPYGKACICGGRGTERAEAQGLRERLADLEIALGFYPNISRRVSKAYDEVREALGGSAHAAAPAPDLKSAPQEYHHCESCHEKTPHRFDGKRFVCYAEGHSELGAAALWVLKAHVSHGDQAIVPAHLITDLARALENSRGEASRQDYREALKEIAQLESNVRELRGVPEHGEPQ